MKEQGISGGNCDQPAGLIRFWLSANTRRFGSQKILSQLDFLEKERKERWRKKEKPHAKKTPAIRASAVSFN
jgi:hypothetical protein